MAVTRHNQAGGSHSRSEVELATVDPRVLQGLTVAPPGLEKGVPARVARVSRKIGLECDPGRVRVPVARTALLAGWPRDGVVPQQPQRRTHGTCTSEGYTKHKGESSRPMSAKNTARS